jgi:hypothetical protein
MKRRLMSGPGHSRRFGRAPGTSACHPIPDISLRRSKPTGQANGLLLDRPFLDVPALSTGFDALTFVAGFLFSGHPHRSARYISNLEPCRAQASGLLPQ